MNDGEINFESKGDILGNIKLFERRHFHGTRTIHHVTASIIRGELHNFLLAKIEGWLYVRKKPSRIVVLTIPRPTLKEWLTRKERTYSFEIKTEEVLQSDRQINETDKIITTVAVHPLFTLEEASVDGDIENNPGRCPG